MIPFVKPTPAQKAEWYTALLRCVHCDRTPLQHRSEADGYYCEDDSRCWVAPDYKRCPVCSGVFEHVLGCPEQDKAR